MVASLESKTSYCDPLHPSSNTAYLQGIITHESFHIFSKNSYQHDKPCLAALYEKVGYQFTGNDVTLPDTGWPTPDSPSSMPDLVITNPDSPMLNTFIHMTTPDSQGENLPLMPLVDMERDPGEYMAVRVLLANFIITLASERYEDCINHTNECIPFAQAQGFPEFVAMGQVCKGSALVRTGETDSGLQLMTEGVAAWEQTGFSAWRPWLRGRLAEGYLLAGQKQSARRELAMAQVLMEQQDEYQTEPFLLKIEGQLEPNSQPV